MVLDQGERLFFFCVDSPFKILYTWAKILFVPPNWSLNFLFFVKFDFSCFFFVFFWKRAISTSTQMRKINYFKNNAWKVERVQKTLKKKFKFFFFFRRRWKCKNDENILKKTYIFNFLCFSLFLDFFENISKTWVKNWVATDMIVFFAEIWSVDRPLSQESNKIEFPSIRLL